MFVRFEMKCGEEAARGVACSPAWIWRPRRDSRQRGTPKSPSSAMPRARREGSGLHDKGHREGGPARPYLKDND